jgi:transposase-like protein
MARKEHGNPVLRQLIKERGIKDLKDIHELVKEMTGSLIQEMLEAELENDLGYSKWDYRNKNTTSSRNGYSEKSLKSSQGEISVKIPRDRDGEFEPQLIQKHQTDISTIEDKILFLYSQGMSTRDIQKAINELYGTSVDDTMVSRITDKILPVLREWQQRPLEKAYALVILDAIHLKVREEGAVVSKAAYVAIGINYDGYKDVLGIWLGASEGAKYWLGVLNEIRARGVEDILIASVDGLKGFVEAIGVAFPKTEVQRCIIHQIRSSTRYVSYKDRKSFIEDLKHIYKAVTEEEALNALEELDNKWSEKYRFAVKSWRDNWNELSTMFKYPPEIRRLIYTTNEIENFNRQLRKATKTKSAFVSDDAAMKVLYLTTMNIVEKWNQPIHGWGTIIGNLSIYFGDRVTMKK